MARMVKTLQAPLGKGYPHREHCSMSRRILGNTSRREDLKIQALMRPSRATIKRTLKRFI